ncbi:Ig-like domain-containing protein [Alloalcanivorax venustensis]|uniref:Ig-like domain-containing protein n=1 Tax=Alloalcanivorax venustensis TaxID=172371 RepID=UPI00351552FE
MKTTILKQSLLLLSSATLLAACGGDGGDSPVDDFGSNPGESGAQGLLYAYPDNGQGEVPTKAPIALRFTSNVAPGNVKQNVTLCCDDAGENLDFDAERVKDEPRGVLLTPTDALAPGTEYTIEISDLRLTKGTAKNETLTFTTRTLQEGPKSEVVQDMDNFELSRTIPNGSELEPVMDFSAFRFQFTQPIDRATASYGDGNSVVLRDSEGAVVEAGLLVDGAYMTVDPTDDYLTPGETYTLSLGGLESTYGETFAGETLEFTPKDSSPRGEPGFLVQRITQSGTSRLTGEAINQVPVNGVLLGEGANFTQAEAERVIAELADVTQYTDVTPIRLPKGTLLEGLPIDIVRIGGTVNAGFGSGDVTMRVLSDATGYLVPNPYTEESPDQLRIVHLFMDVGIATENPQANGGFTQNLLHIHLVGVAEVDPNGGVLNIDATSMVEPDVLGLEYGYGLLSFQLQSYKDQNDALLAEARAAMEDTTPPTLQSWSLGENTLTGDDKAQVAKPGDPVILNFDQPLDPESVAGNVQLFHNNNPMDIDYYIDGAALVIKPKAVREETTSGTKITPVSSLQLSPADNPNIYRVEIDGVANVAGDLAAGMPLIEEFELATIVPDYDLMSPEVSPNFDPAQTWVDRIKTSHAPVILAAYPGYPCALQEEFIEAGGVTGLLDDENEDIGQTYRDLSNGVAGMCAGGGQEITDGTELDNQAADDPIPVMDMPANRPIIIAFGKEIDPATVVLGETFLVERINEDEQVVGEVDGTVEISDMTLQFHPKEPWQDGELYRYTLKSSGWAICASSSGRAYRVIANDATESTPCDLGPTTEVIADHRNFQCGVDTVCGNQGLPLRTMPLAMNAVKKISDYEEEATRHYGWRTYGPSLTAGGPEMTHFFRGAAPSPHVLQVLRTQPVADTNHNFVSDRSSVGNGDLESMLDLRDWFVFPGGESEERAIESISVGEFDYDIEEYGPEGPLTAGDPAFNQYPDYDPNGMKPAKNSAKVLSRFDPQDLGGTAQTVLAGVNVGCGYNFEFSTEPPASLFMPDSEVGEPRNCPDNKFTYLTSAAIAEVTDEVDENGRIKVNLWPSIVMGTSLELSLDTNALNAVFYSASVLSGPQILRMRYSGAEKDQPITGWISEQNQSAELSMDMRLYVDAPYASDWSPLDFPVSLISYPIEMNLEGGVTFLDDGRMEVEQYNTNLIDLYGELWGSSGQIPGQPVGYMDLFIPEHGSRINMISEPIK